MSTAPWIAEQSTPPELAESLITERFPELVPVRLRRLGVGWDNTAYLVNDTYVFRFPRREIALPYIARALRLLPAIAEHLPVAIPLPRFVGSPGPRFEWPFAGFSYVSGTTACSASLDDDARRRAAIPLARFMAALHAFPIARAEELGAVLDPLGRFDFEKRATKATTDLAECRAASLVDAVTERALLAIVHAAKDAAPRPRALAHGDLYARHLVFEGGALKGVIDWDDMHIADPAVDLSVAFTFLPPDALATFEAEYGSIDEPTRRLARLRGVCHTAMVALFAMRTEQASLLRESLDGLERLAAP